MRAPRVCQRTGSRCNALQIVLGREGVGELSSGPGVCPGVVPRMPMLAKIDQTTVDANTARHLPNTQNVSTADTLDEACDVVSRNIYPHRLRLAAPAGRA